MDAIPYDMQGDLAGSLLREIERALQVRIKVHIVMGGGRSPVELHKMILGHDMSLRLDWTRVELWVSDERLVPIDHAASNRGLIWNTLARPLGMNVSQVHGPDGEAVPSAAARQYAGEVKACFSNGGFVAAAVLGIGADGHTAGLFPGGPWQAGQVEEWAVATGKGPEGFERISMSPRALLQANRIYLLANSSAKIKALEEAWAAEPDPSRYPLQLYKQAIERLSVHKQL
jgi:6-phosphogluconolactonase